MGFFSDLKEDLSQAVNELIPGENGEMTEKQAQTAQEDNSANELPFQEQEDEETLKQLAELERILQNIELPAEGEEDKNTAKSTEGEATGLVDYEPLGNQEEAMAQNDANTEVAALEKQDSDSADASDSTDTEEGASEENASKENASEANASVTTEEVSQMAISISLPDEETAKESEAEIQATVGEFQDAVAALKDSVEEQKAQEQAETAEADEDLEQELRATFGAQEGEETVEDYMHAEAIRTGADIIDKSWVLDLKGMETMDETAIITAGMRVKGDILSNGSADVIGEVIGNVQVKGKLNVTGKINGNAKAEEIFADSAKINGDMISDSTVKIGVNSVVIGNIEATSAVIAGAVKGTIDVKGPVILDATAVVLGNVRAKSMQINNGARIEGMCVLCYAEQSAAKFFEEQASM